MPEQTDPSQANNVLPKLHPMGFSENCWIQRSAFIVRISGPFLRHSLLVILS